MKVKMWHAPYNGGWIWFDKNQINRFNCGGFSKDYKYAHLSNGKPDICRTVWWCFFGFCGQLTLQSWPWQKNPAHKTKEQQDARPEMKEPNNENAG